MKYKYWTQQEIDFLKENYGRIPAKEIAERLNKTYSSITSKANKLRICFNDDYTDKEIEILKKYYNKISLSLLVKKLKGRTKKSIKDKASKLKITKRKIMKKWTEDEIDFLKKNYGKKLAKDIGKRINRNPKSIRDKAHLLKLKINKKNFSKLRREQYQKEELKTWNKGILHTKKAKQNMSLAQKRVWQNPEYREKQIKRLLNKHFEKPTQLEQRFDAFFKQNNLPFHYVGDGQLIIGGKCPDFVCNPLKLVVEVGNKIEKSIKRKGRNYFSWQDYQRQRKAHFKRYFFDCICLWEEDLKKNPNKMLDKIRGFIS